MKKLVVAIIGLAFISNVQAQEAADKKFQAGLTAAAGLNFQKMETKRFVSNGAGSDLTIGGAFLWNFSKTIGISTGVEFDFETIKYKDANYEGKKVYYYYNDADILRVGDVDAANLGNNKIFQLDERRQKATYLTIPLMGTFRTNFFGYWRYFGKFGLRNSFLLASKINDTGFNFANNDIINDQATAGSNENMSAPREMFFFKSSVGIAGGAEWNFSGSTTLVAELGYYYGFTPLHSDFNTDKLKNYYFATDQNNGGGNDVQFNNAAKQSQLQLKVSILF